jgi:hypothetical protein
VRQFDQWISAVDGCHAQRQPRDFESKATSEPQSASVS